MNVYKMLPFKDLAIKILYNKWNEEVELKFTLERIKIDGAIFQVSVTVENITFEESMYITVNNKNETKIIFIYNNIIKKYIINDDYMLSLTEIN